MNLRTALALAAFLILAALAGAYLGDDDTARRVQGVSMGLVLAIFANTIPKQLPPFRGSTHAAQAQSYQRFAAWTFVLAGLGHALMWVVLPVGMANTMAMVLVGGAVVLVFATCVVARARVRVDGAE